MDADESYTKLCSEDKYAHFFGARANTIEVPDCRVLKIPKAIGYVWPVNRLHGKNYYSHDINHL